MKNVYDYLIARYGQQNSQPNLYIMILELQEKIKVLEDKYQNSLRDIKKLEEENIETSNCIYELQNSIEDVNRQIHILHGEK